MISGSLRVNREKQSLRSPNRGSGRSLDVSHEKPRAKMATLKGKRNTVLGLRVQLRCSTKLVLPERRRRAGSLLDEPIGNVLRRDQLPGEVRIDGAGKHDQPFVQF